MLRPALLLFVLTTLGVTTSALVCAATPADFLKLSYKDDGGETLYRLFVPKTYSKEKKYPLILFLHGSGEAGTDNEAQLTKDINGAMALVSDANQEIQPSFLLVPQIPKRTGWRKPYIRAHLLAIIEKTKLEYGIDADRIYVTGISWGGQGSWDQISQNPDLYAAAVPMSGAGNLRTKEPVGNEEKFAKIPVWNFHAEDDKTVKIIGSDNQIAEFERCGGHPIFTRYKTGGHQIWPTAYKTPGLYTWLMAQKRGAPSPASGPMVSIAQSSGTSQIESASRLQELSGTIPDASTAVTKIEWECHHGNHGSAAGTNTWCAKEILLQPGENRILVRAYGSTWSNLGGDTIFSSTIGVNYTPPK